MDFPSKQSGALNIILVWLGFFTGWTVCSIPLTLFGAPFSMLWIAFVGGGVGVGLGLASRGVLADILLVVRDEPLKSGPLRSMDMAIIIVVIIGVLGATVIFIPTGDARVLWGVLLVSAVFVLWRTRGAEPVDHWVRHAPPSVTATLILGLALFSINVVVLRADGDDAFYLNLPMGIINASHGMLVWDTMYGAQDWPVLGTNYRVEGMQTFIAAMSWASGLSVVFVSHVILPAIWCLVWAATVGVLGTSLFGSRWWVFAVLAVVSTFVFAGTLQSWGVHGITRLFHGKALLILIIVPLLFMVTLRADALKMAMLKIIPIQSGLIIAAIGLTANSIYLAPLVLGLTVCANWLVRGFRTPQRLLVLVAVTPAVAIGLWLMFFDPPVSVPPVENPNFAGLAVWNMFPNKILLALMALTLAASVLAAFVASSARFFAACTVGALIFIINPFIWPLYDGFVTGGLNFRLWWALPVPFVFAVLLSWGIIQFDRLRWMFPSAVCALCALSVLSGGLFGMPETDFSPSLTKRPVVQSLVAQSVVDTAQGAKVLAVEEIAEWIPTFQGHPPQVYIRQIYLDQNLTVVPAENLGPRIDLYKWINNSAEVNPDELSRALMHQCPEVIVISTQNLPSGFAAFVAQYGAQLTRELRGYAIFNISIC